MNPITPPATFASYSHGRASSAGGTNPSTMEKRTAADPTSPASVWRRCGRAAAVRNSRAAAAQVTQRSAEGDHLSRWLMLPTAHPLDQPGSRLRHAVRAAVRVVWQRDEHGRRTDAVHPDDREPRDRDAAAQG